MRIAVINPVFLLQNQEKNFNGYNYLFFMEYVSVIYVTDLRRYHAFKVFLEQNNRNDVVMVTNGRALNKAADVVISFNGVPNRFFHRFPKKFYGLKICHIMDYVFYASKANRALEKYKVNYLLGYCNHGKYCKFFRQYFPSYVNRVISQPFGYGKRFQDLTAFEERQNKAIALGSVNPVRDMKGVILKEYSEFYRDEEFTHRLRRQVVLHREEWGQWIDDKLPVYPDTKNPYYNPVEELNKYTMFINDAGLMNFPPARTYEGIASGCVMVAERLEVWGDFGFQDGINCILFEKGNYEDMIKKIGHYQDRPDELKVLQVNSLKLAESYSHDKLARKLYDKIVQIADEERVK